MKMVCDRCWERCCKCSPVEQEADRQKVIEEYRKSMDLPVGWQPGQIVKKENK